MCVIICCEDEFPSLQILEDAELTNPHGAGVAWVEGNMVKWKKGLSSQQVFDLTRTISLPAVIHFRISTVGGTPDELCHPFPITEGVETSISGQAKQVLFHNGMWSEWNDVTMKTVINSRHKFPDGKHWSDSRAMAWLAEVYGNGFLNLIEDQKIAVLTPEGIQRYGSYWPTVEGFKCSNSHFEKYYNPIENNIKVNTYTNIEDWKKSRTQNKDKILQEIKDAEKEINKLRRGNKKNYPVPDIYSGDLDSSFEPA